MITQRQFTEIHVSFWELLCPNMHRLVRSINLSGRDVFSAPMQPSADPSRTFFVNEVAFEVYCRRSSGTRIIKSELMDAVRSQFSYENNISDILPDLDKREILEANNLSSRISNGIPFYIEKAGEAEYRPKFTGVGILSDCYGDVRHGNVLIEIKSGERNLRSSDLQQVITYYILSILSGSNPLKSCLVLNARQGYRCFFEFSDLIEASSGIPLVEFTASFRDYLVDWKACD